MKAISSSRKHHYLKSISIFLIVIALVAGIVSCDPGRTPKYDLTMAVDPPGSGTATDVTGASPYAAGTAVDIQATANPGYQFVNWTAPEGTFGDANAARTIFTMPAKDAIITAEFLIQLDHFKCYNTPGEPPYETVFLEDQFVAIDASLNWTQWFCNPAEKVHDGVTPIWHPSHHLTIYSILYEGQFEQSGFWEVMVDNQFGTNQEFTVEGGPWWLAVPTQKLEPEHHNPPLFLDHFLVYRANGPAVQMDISLTDQFDDEEDVVEVVVPWFFANPCRKTHDGNVTEIKNPEAHLVLYIISDSEINPNTVHVDNQFGEQDVDWSYGASLLAVPSEKLSAEFIEFED